jgi:acetate kinase
MLVMVVNAGSSSLKYQLVDTESEVVWASGLVERIGEAQSRLVHKTRIRTGAQGELTEQETLAPIADHKAAFHAVTEAFTATGAVAEVGDLVAVGHRIVQGGDQFVEPTVITPNVIEVIRSLNPLAPLHNPAGVAGIESAMTEHPQVPHVAVFDTAFHATIPPAAYTYAIDSDIAKEHRIRRYGFHGTSHKYVTARAAEQLGKSVQDVDLVTLHLGNGASACAVRGGKSVETSMGLTPLEGLMMGTRSGDIDPAIVFHLITTAGMSAAEVDSMLNKRSGLFGLCGQNDLRQVQALAAAGDARAELALGVYVHRIRKYLGAYLAVLGHADAVVFTAGVGENDSEIRRRVIEGLDALGLSLDPESNASARGSSGVVDVSAPDSAIRVLVVPTNEELEIARQAVLSVSP